MPYAATASQQNMQYALQYKLQYALQYVLQYTATRICTAQGCHHCNMQPHSFTTQYAICTAISAASPRKVFSQAVNTVVHYVLTELHVIHGVAHLVT